MHTVHTVTQTRNLYNVVIAHAHLTLTLTYLYAVASNSGVPIFEAMEHLASARKLLTSHEFGNIQGGEGEGGGTTSGGRSGRGFGGSFDLEDITKRALGLGGACAPLHGLADSGFGPFASSTGHDQPDTACAVGADSVAVLDHAGVKCEVFRRAAGCVGVFLSADRALFNYKRHTDIEGH